MVQAAEDGRAYDPSAVPWFDGARLGGILAEPEMRTRPVVVGDVLPQYPPQVALAEHDHVVQALSPD